MKLYHGTSARNLDKICKHGLRPRAVSKRKTNWVNNPSHPDAVYLTSAYGGFYAGAACKSKEHWAILEIDTGLLNPFAFAPDEDALEQVGRYCDGIPGSMQERTKIYRKRLWNYASGITDPKDAAAVSLKVLGNCTYLGTVPPTAITRLATVDPKVAKQFVYGAFDPCILLINYQIMGPWYRNTLKWLFEEPLEEMPYKLYKLPEDRNGITVTAFEQETRQRQAALSC